MISFKLGLVALAVFNVADYFFTLWALERGFTEANPFMDAIINTPWFAVIKLGIIPCALLAVWIVEDRLRAFARSLIWVGLLAYGGLMIYHGRVVLPHIL